MQIAPRTDLGGYGAVLAAVAAASGTEITRPFVLLCGPNGSGKTTILRMMRSALGLTGARAGRAGDSPGEMFARRMDIADCQGDLGRLMGCSWAGGGAKVPADEPGILDIASLGWTGQRTWLFESRAETNLLAAGAFDDDIGYHVGLLMGGATRASHGQMMKNGWTTAMRWATHTLDHEDPFDTPSSLPPRHRHLFETLCPSGIRPDERWLLLDEPEVALDAEAMAMGLSVLLRSSAIGKLRVFCASHSPIFAAGLADDPAVQVVDLGGRRPWLSVQKRLIEVAREPDTITSIAEDIIGRMRESYASERKAARKQQLDRLRAATRNLGPEAIDALIAALGSAGRRLPKSLSHQKATGLEERGLVRIGGALTPLGVEAAEHLKVKRGIDAVEAVPAVATRAGRGKAR